MRSLLVILLVLLLVPGWSGEERLPLYGAHPSVTAVRVPLDAKDPARRTLGALTYLGGLHLSSRDPAFGGFSALAVRGDRFLLLSDGGLTYAFRMGRDLTLSDHQFGALPAGPGTGWNKRDRDSESLTVDPVSGQLWVGFERANAVWRYAPDLSRATAKRAPPEMARWPENAGPEAMTRLPDGRFLIFAENAHDPAGGRRALLFDRDPTDPKSTTRRLRLLLPEPYRPTDAALTPDGRLLILARAVSIRDGFTARLLLADAPDARGAIRTHELATFAYPILHDNFEGLAITREGGATIVWLVSDDNGPSLFQRTLLLKFRLDLPPTPNAAPTGWSERR